MSPAGFEPTILASERPQNHVLDRAATGIKGTHYWSLSRTRRIQSTFSYPDLLICILYRVSQKSLYRDNNELNCDYFHLSFNLSFAEIDSTVVTPALSSISCYVLMFALSLHVGSKCSCVSLWTVIIMSVKRLLEHPVLFSHLRLHLQNYLFIFVCAVSSVPHVPQALCKSHIWLE
jgi:hypothetical protein